MRKLALLAGVVWVLAFAAPASASHGWNPYPWRVSPQGAWDYAWYVNAMQTAKLCRYHGLIPCGNTIYGDGEWFRQYCQSRHNTQYDVALIIENRATQAQNWWGAHGITVHWSQGGGYPPTCYFTTEADWDVQDF
ncbi:MAG TPA: hypothetical protein VGQ68_09530 [Gaiellaceae bacterium]|nr:hypothetical protein [Gaiellaceae bacterium]